MDADGEDTTVMVDSDDAEIEAARVPRKRGRPPTRRLRLERERLREEREKYELLDRGRTLSGRKGRIRLDIEEDKIWEMKENPTTDLSVEVLEQTALINNVTDISKNLKGTSVKVLRDAAATIKAAVTIITDRMQGDGRYDEDKEADRREIRILKKEIAKLHKKRKEEDEIREELQRMKEERSSMLQEMANLRKLVQELCEAPVLYPHLSARTPIDKEGEGIGKGTEKSGKPRIREIISIPSTQEMKRMEMGLQRMTLEKEGSKGTETTKVFARKGNSKERTRVGREINRNVDITRTVNKIKEGKRIKLDIGNKGKPNTINNTKSGNLNKERIEKGKGEAKENTINNGVTWSQIVGRKTKVEEQKRKDNGGKANKDTTGMAIYPKTMAKKGREPRTAAIIVNCTPGKGKDVMR